MPPNKISDDKMSRRSLLQAGAAGCAGAVMMSSVNADPSKQPKISIDKWQSAIGHDVRIVGKSFSNEPSIRPISLRLVDVTQNDVKTQSGETLPAGIPTSTISFCLHGNKRIKLESATYQVSFPGIGEFELFVNEVQPDPGSPYREFESILC